MGNSWCIFFSHPADFSNFFNNELAPVCTTELGIVEKLSPEFKKRNVKTIGLSVDTVEEHKKWIQDINEIEDKGRKIATQFDMLDSAEHDPTNIVNGLPLTVRSVFIIDPLKKIRLTFTYPASCGRNFDEILRVIDSLQLSDKKPVTTPANWKVGDKVIIHPKISDEDAKKNFPNHEVLKPYLRMTNLS